MSLINKEQLLEELIEGQEAGLGLKHSRYGNINSIDDAIETVKYADEVDLSEHDKQIKQQTLNAIIDFANKHIFDEDREIDAQVTCAIEWAVDEISKAELPQLSQFIPAIGEEEIPFGNANVSNICESYFWYLNDDPEKGCQYDFRNKQGSRVHIFVSNIQPRFIDVSFEAGALYKNYIMHDITEDVVKYFTNKEVTTRMAEKIFAADKNMSLQDWLNDYKTLFLNIINNEINKRESIQAVNKNENLLKSLTETVRKTARKNDVHAQNKSEDINR